MDIGHAQRSVRGDLRYVGTRFSPMEMRLIGGKHNHCTHGVSGELALIELLTQADVEDSRDHGVDAIFGVFMRHQSGACRYAHADHIRSGLLGFANEDGYSRGRRIRSQFPPLKIFRPDRAKHPPSKWTPRDIVTSSTSSDQRGLQRNIGLTYALIVVDPRTIRLR